MSAFKSFFNRNSNSESPASSRVTSPILSTSASTKSNSRPTSPISKKNQKKDSISSATSFSSNSITSEAAAAPSDLSENQRILPSNVGLPSIDVQSPSPSLLQESSSPSASFFPDPTRKITAEPQSSISPMAKSSSNRPPSSGNGVTSSPNNLNSSPSTQNKPTRRGSRHAQEDSGAPNRHELMRRAMAEAMMGNDHDGPLTSSNDDGKNGGMSHSVSGPSMVGLANGNGVGAGAMTGGAAAVARRPSTSGANAGRKSLTNGIENGVGNGKGGEEGTSTCSPSNPPEKPGEGSLTIDAFSADGTDTALVDGAPQPMIFPSAGPTTFPPNQSTPKRPELGSRNSSFSGPSSNGKAGDKSSNTGESSQKKSDSSKVPSSSPGNHGRYATTMSSVDPRTAVGKSGSLAPPVLSNGTNSILSDTAMSTPSKQRTQGMAESNSTSALLTAPPSPGALSRFRRNSNSDLNEGSAKKKDKKDKDSGGIAGALALGMTGMAGIGGSGAAMQVASQHLQTTSKFPTSPRRKSGSGDGYQGGVYRDPSTGTVIERDDQGNDYTLNRDPKDRRDRSPSTTSSFGNGSISGYSTSSGLGAAAGFGSAIAGGNLLSPEAASNFPRPSMSRSSSTGSLTFDPRRLTPDGIGAVGGLSPSGMGEHVGILDVAGFRGRAPSESGSDEGRANGWDHGDLGMGGQITGFAVASSKRNSDFHALFHSVPEDDYLIEGECSFEARNHSFYFWTRLTFLSAPVFVFRLWLRYCQRNSDSRSNLHLRESCLLSR